MRILKKKIVNDNIVLDVFIICQKLRQKWGKIQINQYPANVDQFHRLHVRSISVLWSFVSKAIKNAIEQARGLNRMARNILNKT